MRTEGIDLGLYKRSTGESREKEYLDNWGTTTAPSAIREGRRKEKGFISRQCEPSAVDLE